MRLRLSDGSTLHYRSRGAGLPVVLLHPVGLDGSIWDGVAAALGSGLRSLVPDLPGHGASDLGADPVTLDGLAATVAQFIAARAGGPALLVGCSLGGMVAQGVALRAPGLLLGMAFGGTGASRTAAQRQAILDRAEAAAGGMDPAIPGTLDRWFSPEARRDVPQAVAHVRALLQGADPVVHAGYWRAMAALDHMPALAGLDLPIRCIAAGDDRSTPAAALRELAAGLRRGSYDEIPGAGHLAPIETPAAYAAAIRRFAHLVAPTAVPPNDAIEADPAADPDKE